MPLNNPRAGFNYAAEYQSSAWPWITSSTAPVSGSPVRYDFPTVTRSITVANLASATNTLSFGFTRNGIVSTSNKYIVAPNSSITIEAHVTSLFIQGENGTPAFNLYAALTAIPATDMAILSGTFADDASLVNVG